MLKNIPSQYTITVFDMEFTNPHPPRVFDNKLSSNKISGFKNLFFQKSELL